MVIGTFYGEQWLLNSLTPEEKEHLRNGGTVWKGSSAYAICGNCRCLVKVNKTFFGGLHVCA